MFLHFFRISLWNVFLMCIALSSSVLHGQQRDIITLQDGWKFAKGQQTGAFSKDFNDKQWENVSLPHDWAIAGPFIPDGDGNTGKLPWKGEGWYRHALQMPAAYKNKRVYLLFDGVMAFPKVYVNGSLAGKWDYGYNSFYLDITEHLLAGKNTLAVHVDTRAHDSRWYPGAGIYRKVQLIAVDPLHINMWGTQVTTPVIKPNYAEVNATAEVINTTQTLLNDIVVRFSIWSPAGKEIIAKEVITDVPPSSTTVFETNLIIPNPQKWDINHGVLYTLRTEVQRGHITVDTYDTPFGIRSMRFTEDHGFYLNDRRVQLKGVNLHHDHGPLGAAFYPRAMERQLQLLKEMGCNAVRTSHNVAAPELLEMCDTMGILVFNEIFDKYDQKADIIDTTNFEAFTERNMANFIKRDRNHPSVFLWSVGNEIGPVQWNEDGGFRKLNTMINALLRYDHTRPTTLVCDSRNSAALRHFDYYDVHSWNYGRRYDLARQLEPNKSVIISESASTVSTRGFYELPLPTLKTDFTKSLQVSSYDLNAPEWAEIADDDFMWQQDEPYIAGEFVWTGFDYLGEPTPYTNEAVKKMGMTDTQASVSSYFGIFDLVGIPKDRYYLYKSYWQPEETTIHILPHWNWSGLEGKSIPVFVYTNGDCAELFLNGKTLGTKCKDPSAKNSVERFRLMWNEVAYEAGELKAVAYKEGLPIGEHLMKTTGDPAKIKLTPDREIIQNDGLDLSYILIEAIDQDGNPCPLADHVINLEVTGNGFIAGVGNGDPQSLEPFQADRVRLFYGKAMLIVRGGTTEGKMEVKATADGLISNQTLIQVQ